MTKKISSTPPDQPVNAPLWRRLAAMLYDFLLCVAIWLVTGLIYFGILNAVYGSEQMQALSESGALDNDPLLASLLFLATFFFFAYFWRRIGQTLGMQAWRLKVVSTDAGPLRWGQCILRFMGAFLSFFCLGLGYLWMLWDKEGKTWHDRYSLTRVILLPPQNAAKKYGG